VKEGEEGKGIRRKKVRSATSGGGKESK